MKRIIALCGAAALCLSMLFGCSSGGSKESEVPSDTVESVQPSEKPSEPSQEPSDVIESVEPTKEPAQGDGVDLAAFAQAVQENHEFHSLERADPEDQELGAVMLGNYYPGIVDLDLAQTEIYLAMISFSGEELAVVEAKNADDAAKVKEIFQARVDSKSEEGPGNYPEEVEKWQRSAKVVDHGNYVMLVNHEDSAAIVDEFNALFS